MLHRNGSHEIVIDKFVLDNMFVYIIIMYPPLPKPLCDKSLRRCIAPSAGRRLTACCT